MQRLEREFYNRDTVQVAQELLGKNLVHSSCGTILMGKIVEVEAYLGPHDLAAHSCKGITPRTRIMYGPPGYAYVYLIYGIHHCMNVVTEAEGHGSAVLIRALEPINFASRCNGPGLLCKAMEITRHLNGQDLISDRLYIADSQITGLEIIKRPRIGVAYAKEWADKLLRFYIKDNPHVSKK